MYHPLCSRCWNIAEQPIAMIIIAYRPMAIVFIENGILLIINATYIATAAEKISAATILPFVPFRRGAKSDM